MNTMLTTLKKVPYLLLTLTLGLIFFGLYTFFDLRQGGTHLTIFSDHVLPFQYFIGRFGLPYVITRVVLDILLAVLSAILIAIVLDRYRNDRTSFTGTACSTGATMILGLATFGCPSCVLPIAGTFGAIFTSQALPLFGFEFKILSLLIVLGTLYWLLRRIKRTAQPGTYVLPSSHAPIRQ